MIVLPDNGLSQEERQSLQALLDRLPTEMTLEQLWRLMDEVWCEYGLDPRAPDPERLSAYYRHPVWLLNGLFVEQDPVSRTIREAVASHVAQTMPAGSRMLDYGGGLGTLARAVAAANPRCEVFLFEPHPWPLAVHLAGQHPNLHLTDDPQPPWDVVLCTDVLEHLSDPLPLLWSLAGSLRPGGQLLIGNCFYPVIRCHLPCTFHLRYTFPLFARLARLRARGRCRETYVEIYEKAGTPASRTTMRVAESLSRCLYLPTAALRFLYRRLRGRTP